MPARPRRWDADAFAAGVARDDRARRARADEQDMMPAAEHVVARAAMAVYRAEEREYPSPSETTAVWAALWDACAALAKLEG